MPPPNTDDAGRLQDLILTEILRKVAAHKARGIPASRIALESGISQGSISRLKSGERGSNPEFLTILKLAIYLEVDMAAIFLPYSPLINSALAAMEQVDAVVSCLGNLLQSMDIFRK